MKTSHLVGLMGLSVPVLFGAADAAPSPPGLRPPATPLVASNPYFSIWSFSDELHGEETKHWTGAPHRLSSLIRVDGACYRLMGVEPADVGAARQTSLRVLPTRTVYTFEAGPATIEMTFLTPSLPDDLDVLARPVTYVTWAVRSRDGAAHEVSVYLDAAAEIAVNEPEQAVVWRRLSVGANEALALESKDQPVLQKRGDNLRIDWGALYVMPRAAEGVASALAPGAVCRGAFAAGSPLPTDDAAMPRPAGENQPVAALWMSLGRVGGEGAERTALLAYDERCSIRYFEQDLVPYWRRSGWEADDLLSAAAREHPELAKRCAAFDAELLADLTDLGGPQYADICSLAYRQCFAANGLAADAAGRPLLFPKENFSNGCIATVDVIYPMAPQFLLLSPSLMKASLRPVMDYAASERWRFPFAPHDLGTYPHSTGQVYGGGERTEENQMPVEESGNMLILLAALARAEGNASFAAEYEPVLRQWAEYLKEKGLDPAEQLCTDDFAGHLAHNVNLSVKAIVALRCYAELCRAFGRETEAAEYRALALRFAREWERMAKDGDHYRLAFDQPGSWSQKYNLVWDAILGFDLFPESIRETEMAHYRRVQNPYGLPLDNRSEYTKLDWILWTATLTGDRDDFDALVAPVWKALDETPSRVPMTDWYWTNNAEVRGFRARPVVGGVFLRPLHDPAMWAKWAGRDRADVGGWAPLPKRPRTETLVATALSDAGEWRYTTDDPGEGWWQPEFDASRWRTGAAGFGKEGTPGARIGTKWESSTIWLRRTFELDAPPEGEVRLLIHHDEDAVVYLNGKLVADLAGYTAEYVLVPMDRSGRGALRAGANTMAVCCRQTTGGQYIDCGLEVVVPSDE